MDLQKAKIFLDKINREFLAMQRDSENISAIDVDLIRQYTRDFYDAILSEKKSVLVNIPTAPMKESTLQKTPSRPIGFNPERAQSVAPPEVFQEKIVPPAAKIFTPPIEEISRPKPTPVLEIEQIVAKTPELIKKPEPIAEPMPIYRPTIEQIQAQKIEPKPPAQASKPSVSSETLALFEFKAATELSERLSETPIADLKKALSLNDRILMTRELFSADPKALDSTLATIQSLTTFEDAKSFLIQFCAEQNNWSDKNRVESARSFIKLVRRRFKAG